MPDPHPHRRPHRIPGLARVHTIAIVGGVVAVLAVAGLAVQWSGAGLGGGAIDAGSTGQDWYTVTPRSFDLSIITSGELEAKDQVEVKSKVGGRTAIIDIVDEGVSVEEGDVLVKLDEEEISEEIEKAKLDVESARADKIAADQDLEIQRSDAASSEDAAKVKLELAKLALAEWASGTVPQKRRELEVALEKAKRRTDRAQRDHELSKKLYSQQFISFNELDDAAVEEIEAKSALQTAKLNIQVYDKYTYQMTQRKNQSDVDQAQAEYQRTIKQNESTLARMQAEVSSATRKLAIREQRLQEKQEQLEACTIRAPQGGLVVYASSVGSRRRRNNPIQPGREVRYNESIVLLPDTAQMIAVMSVHEALLPQIKTGQPVSVSIDARPGRIAQGKVTQIAVTAEDGGWLNPNLREYKVRVILPEGYDKTLKPAMRCSGQILTGRVEDALAVPVQAIFADGEQHYCYTPTGDGHVRRSAVRVGRSSEDFVEITQGLDAEDRVLMRHPRPGEVVDNTLVGTDPAPADPTPADPTTQTADAA